ncbi:MAG: hypothetical protein EOP83_14435, partial [Verrucomicrobiaceae bacterium]
GSEGGSAYLQEGEASILATYGYDVLTYCYFDCDRDLVGPRATLKNVEVTKLQEAIRWLRSRPTSNGKVVVYGFSRGAELALIAGANFVDSESHPDALIAHAPSDVYNTSWNWSWEEPSCWKNAGNRKTWNSKCGREDPVVPHRYSRRGLSADPRVVETQGSPA